MKTVVALIVYTRFDNLKRWIDCWFQCEQKEGVEFVVVHNYDKDEDCIKYGQLCLQNEIGYYPRKNVGMDIGAFQDICKERLAHFPNNWDRLLWIADDTLPMSKTFVSQYLSKMIDNVGCVAMEISKESALHVRTTGFMITKAVSRRLKFPADRITTKEQCYYFEHRGKSETMLLQISRMQLSILQVAPLDKSPLWDTGHRALLRRENEFYSVFSIKASGKVTFICPIYNSYPEIVGSLICQTYQNWELILIHDGVNTTGLRKLIEVINDKRIKYIETSTRAGNWGHSYRKWALEEIRKGTIAQGTDYIVVTNADNYHTPVYCEYMIDGFKKNENAVAIYCETMVHSYLAFTTQRCRPERGHIDSAGVMVRKDVACETGWRDTDAHSSDWTYFEDILNKYGKESFVKVRGTLFVHN